jgi:hypothetical protein
VQKDSPIISSEVLQHKAGYTIKEDIYKKCPAFESFDALEPHEHKKDEKGVEG